MAKMIANFYATNGVQKMLFCVTKQLFAPNFFEEVL